MPRRRPRHQLQRWCTGLTQAPGSQLVQPLPAQVAQSPGVLLQGLAEGWPRAL